MANYPLVTYFSKAAIIMGGRTRIGAGRMTLVTAVEVIAYKMSKQQAEEPKFLIARIKKESKNLQFCMDLTLNCGESESYWHWWDQQAAKLCN